MLTKEGVKLLDFGVARMRRAPFAEPTGTGSTTPGEASEGAVFGTINYMAPEQLAGREADARTDLFAFGALLFEMLTGRRAFDGSSPTAIVAAILDHAPPPVSEHQPLAPPALVQLVSRCLAKDPDERWDSSRLAADVLRDVGNQLVQPLTSGQRAPRLEPRRRWRAWWPAAIACVSTTVLMFAAFTWGGVARKEPAVFQRLDLEPRHGFSRPPAPECRPGVSGRFPHRLRRRGAGRRTVPGTLRKLEQPDAVLIEGTAGHIYPFFSPDGRSVAYFAEKGLFKVGVAGGAPVPLCDAAVGTVRGGTWGDDGTIVAALSSAGGLSRIPSSGGVPSSPHPAGSRQTRGHPPVAADAPRLAGGAVHCAHHGQPVRRRQHRGSIARDGPTKDVAARRVLRQVSAERSPGVRPAQHALRGADGPRAPGADGFTRRGRGRRHWGRRHRPPRVHLLRRRHRALPDRHLAAASLFCELARHAGPRGCASRRPRRVR